MKVVTVDIVTLTQQTGIIRSKKNAKLHQNLLNGRTKLTNQQKTAKERFFVEIQTLTLQAAMKIFKRM